MSCNVVMLFTCTLVRSHPDSKESIRCETRPIEINSKILGWAWQQDACSGRETRRRFSLSLQHGHEGHFREVLQKMAVQVCTIHDYAFRPYNFVCPIDMPCMILELIHLTDCYLFSQVKNKP